METRDSACLVGCVNKVFMQTLAVDVGGSRVDETVQTMEWGQNNQTNGGLSSMTRGGAQMEMSAEVRQGKKMNKAGGVRVLGNDDISGKLEV